jgi:hypothetical protein
MGNLWSDTNGKIPKYSKRYGLKSLRFESRCGEIFRNHSDRPQFQPSFLYKGCRFSFPAVKRPVRGTCRQPPFWSQGRECVVPYLYRLSVPAWHVTARDLPLLTYKAVLVQICPFEIPHGLAWGRALTLTMWDLQQTDWDMIHSSSVWSRIRSFIRNLDKC